MSTLKKVLDILEVFLNGGKEFSILELAQITGQNVSTIRNILVELMQRGYIKQEQKRGKYSLGLKFFSFSSAIDRIVAIEDVFHPFMVELSEQVNETVNLALRDGKYTVSVSIIHSTHRLRVVTDRQSGGRIPLYCTGIGKIFLAGMTDDQLETYLSSESLISFTPNTITNRNKLIRQIKKIRKDGIAYDVEECELGIRNVAAPVVDYNGKILAAIGVLGPSVRLSKKRMREIAPIVKKYTLEASKVHRSRKHLDHIFGDEIEKPRSAFFNKELS